MARRGGRYAIPRPFVKWAGGKGQLLGALTERMPVRFGTYHEPFAGGGALFFNVRPGEAVLSDGNERLIRTYRGVRDDVDGVIERLARCRNDKDDFLEARRRTIDDEAEDAEVAAWMIFLNKTAYNGLYRVNSRNGFNVPFGSYANPRICDPDNLRACAELLQGVDLRCEDFEQVLRRAKPGDFVYFDPPYVPLTETSSFTSYTADGFDFEDQVRLRDVAWTLKDEGVHVMLSNSSAPLVYELYAEKWGFEYSEVLVPRAINSKANGRGKVTELVIW